MNFLQPFNYCLYPYRHSYYYNLYPDNIQEQNSSTATYKSEVISWLSTLEQSELYKLFQIKGQMKTFPIMKMHINDKLNNPSIYALRLKETINFESKIDDQFMMNFKGLHPKVEELYSKLSIVDDENFMDTIFVAEPHLENLNSFLDLLHDLSDKYFLSTPPKAIIEKAEDPFWFHQNSFHSCAVWIIKEFEKNISFHYNLHREKKKKQRLFRQPIYKNTSNELKEFFLQNLANNKERLTFYFQEIYSEIKQQPDRLENKFYENIFSGTAIKLLKSQVELLLTFQQKCHTDTNIINSMLITSMNDLVDQKTYILKKFYKIVQQLFQEHLEQELFKTEISDKKQKKDKKKKKKKFQKMNTFKGLDPIELNKRLSSKNLLESNILRFQRSHSQSNLAYTYVTPPNTPSAWETSDDQNEYNKISNTQQQSSKFQHANHPKINLTQQPLISQQFHTHLENPTNDDYVDVGQSITTNILEIATLSLNDENQFKEQYLKDKKRAKKKQKGFQKSIPESRDEQLQLQSPQSEITRFSIETQAQTIKSHCSNRTSSTSEEEESKEQSNKMKNQIKIRNNSTDKQQNIYKLINSFKMNQFENQQFQQDINSASNESEQISQKTLEDDVVPKNRKKNQQLEVKKNLSIKQESPEKSLKEQLENVQQKGKQKLIEQINSDILDFTDNIMSEYEEMLPFRFLAFERVKSVIQKVFLGIPDGMITSRLFGSCATGLALLDSDIDIGINGLEVYNRNMLKSHFDNLYFEFSRKKWVVKANPIFNSSVPIIKLEIDPQINIFEYEGRNLDEQQIQLWKRLKQKLKSGIKVDISFNFNGNGIYSTHLGSITTDLVKKWMEEYPSLQQIVLILKSMIKKLKLSESYTGGLSSYSLIIMVYSYMREQRVASNLIGEQFVDLINFYINCFDSSSTGIGLLADIHNPNSSYFFNLQDYCLPMLPITIFNPYNRKLLTHSCVQINKIFDFFKVILKELDAKKEFYCNYVVLGKKKQQKLNKSLENFIVSILEQIK
ncbi:unnamed protein product (macronuclear) [Paramecium tetraurelia]|uniref:Poly(A) RNA polymerase mitochondrial-like central palm domain-containing protein n=1 Tax=Paramecium tetraurelia TaxID=5888 RepID=A0DYR3_PARTE|nr:uncharacterized protein GSPATT00003148001 [Paramecium tetraurelia]CAK88180.1 unnamed protein product [Paramecium tetraurelia]|eukprot:XP_001455577.1 hypothetical protein (macronuclear) [Paramecium tetraurelia strain d4-2]